MKRFSKPIFGIAFIFIGISILREPASQAWISYVCGAVVIVGSVAMIIQGIKEFRRG